MIDEDYGLIKKETKRWAYWLVGLFFVVGAILWFTHKAESVATQALIDYEQFEEIYQTCEKINADLCIMKSLPEGDKMFAQFSKPQRVSAMQLQLNRWIADYNAKSNMWHKSMWKSSRLPYQLSQSNFNCNQ